MTTVLKRTTGLVAVVVSTIVLLCSVGGVVGLWMLQGQIRIFATAIFVPLDSGLDTTERTLGTVSGRLGEARDRIVTIRQSVEQLGRDPTSSETVLGGILDKLNAKLEPQIEQARQSVANAVQLMTGLNHSVEALNKLHGLNLPTLTDELQGMQTRVTTLDQRVQQLRADLNAMAPWKTQDAGYRLNSLLEDLNAALQNIQTASDKQLGKIRQVQLRVATLKNKLSICITIIWIGGTLFLAWIAVSQIVMLRQAWSLTRRATLPNRSSP